MNAFRSGGWHPGPPPKERGASDASLTGGNSAVQREPGESGTVKIYNAINSIQGIAAGMPAIKAIRPISSRPPAKIFPEVGKKTSLPALFHGGRRARRRRRRARQIEKTLKRALPSLAAPVFFSSPAFSKAEPAIHNQSAEITGSVTSSAQAPKPRLNSPQVARRSSSFR